MKRNLWIPVVVGLLALASMVDGQTVDRGMRFITRAGDGKIRLQNDSGTVGVVLDVSGGYVTFRNLADSGNTGLGGSFIANSNASVTSGTGTGITPGTTNDMRFNLYSTTVDRTAFVAAATTADVTLLTLPVRTRLLQIHANLTQTFACGATCTTSTLSMTCGTSTGGNQLLVSFDLDAATQVVGDTDAELGTSINRANAVQGAMPPNFSSTTPISCRLISGTGNIGNGSTTNLSQGSVTFYITTERL